ncbi:hypothetical protein EKN06_09275 [Croceicoccus ponticola]|uniref:DUF5801 domain-containing protein n=1 Tax=Croceicoccus ponticola TaxID=2217664 RepID=A0A437GY50_9SPHN|nr:DUF5801 repeats-in-toxin domain-containing protein [Croceicoccus ponticola]RVQ67101.1 hypothetical protein EKN06_09275 [Croceicoccus ponticola]
MAILIETTVSGDVLKLDESGGIQFQDPVDDDPDPQASGVLDDNDDDDVVLTVTLAGDAFDTTTSALDSTFLTFLNGLNNGTFLSDAQMAYAAGIGGASDADFLTVTATGGESANSVFFSDPDGNPLNGDQVWLDYPATTDPLQTIDGDNVYLWTVAGGSIVLATTSSVDASSGTLVAAFYLEPGATSGDPPEFPVKIESVFFVPFEHPDATDPDDAINFTDLLNVSVSGSLSFDFDNLESGSFLWAAVGDGDAGLLVTGQDLNVNRDAASSKYGEIIKGGADPSDTVNTSQGGIGATIGILSQHFTGNKDKGVPIDGPVGVFTLVTGFAPLETSLNEQATGIDVENIDYDGYINTGNASIFISQSTGGPASFRVELLEAGGGTTPEESFGYIYSDVPPATEDELYDDTEVDVASVTVTRGAEFYTKNSDGTTSGSLTGVTITIVDSTFEVTGIMTADTVSFNAEDGSTFNRFTVQGMAGTNAFDIGRIDIEQGETYTQAIGSDLLGDDDGPVASATGTPEALVLDETDAATSPDPDGDNAAPAGTTTATTSGIAALFNGSFGSDKEGSTDFALELSNDDIGSGLFVLDNTTVDGKGTEVLLYQLNATTIIGYVGDSPGDPVPTFDTIFTITVDNDDTSSDFGEVTFAFGADYANLWHPENGDGDADDAVELDVGGSEHLRIVQTLTDGDGESSSAYRDLGSGVFFVEDDGPVAGTAGTPTALYVDESDDSPDPDGVNNADAGDTSATANLGALFTGEGYGTDGAGETAYSLLLSGNGIGSGLFSLDASETDGKGAEILLAKVGNNIVGYVGDPNDAADVYFTISVDNDDASIDFGKVTFSQSQNVWHGDTTDDDDVVSVLVDGTTETFVLRQTVTDADGDSVFAEMDLSANVFHIEDDGPEIDDTTIATNLFVSNVVGDTVEDDFDFSNVSDAVHLWSIIDAPGDFDATSPFPATGFSWRYADVDLDAEVGEHEIIGTFNGTDLYSLYIDDDGSGTATYHFELLAELAGGSLKLDVTDIKAGGPQTNFIDVGALNTTDYVKISGYFDTDGSGTIDLATEGAAINESNLNVGVSNGNLDPDEALAFSLYNASNQIQDITGIKIGTKTAQGFNYSWEAYLDGNLVDDGSSFVGKNGTITIDLGAGNFFDTVILLNDNGNAVKIGLSDIEILTNPPDYLLEFDARLTDGDGDFEDFGFQIGIDGDGSGGVSNPITASFVAPDLVELQQLAPIV